MSIEKRLEVPQILVVDDDPLLAKVIARKLNSSAPGTFEIISVTTADLALKMVCPDWHNKNRTPVTDSSGVVPLNPRFAAAFVDDSFPAREADLPRGGMGKSFLENVRHVRYNLWGDQQPPFDYLFGISSEPSAQEYIGRYSDLVASSTAPEAIGKNPYVIIEKIGSIVLPTQQ
ncbi:MAG: response regulator [Candidatus Saccharimonadales bacterium]